MKNILVIGSLNMDLVINTNRLPVLGETIYGNGFNIIPGGKGQNQAVAAARMGCNVKMIGAVGNDIFGKKLLQNLKDDNIDSDGIKVLETNSGIAMITVCNGDNEIILESGANAKIDEKMIDDNEELLDWSDIVILQFEIPKETVMYAIKKANKKGKIVILNPAPMIDFDIDILKYVDIFVPNQHEAGLMLGMKVENYDDAKIAIEKFAEIGVKNPVITLGSDGSIFKDGEKTIHQNVFKIDVVDTTAAGDSFVGGIAKGISEGWNMSDTIRFATAVSTLAISKKGATSSIPKLADVEEFLKDK